MIGNHLEPFKFWCQKVLPNVYDDSLSYYEYLCKLNEYLNEVIGQINTLTDNMEDYESDLSAQWSDYKDALNAEWTETKNYIDNYFNNLDVQQEINNKLDQMAQSGALSTLLAPIVGTQLGGVVAQQIGGTVANQIGDTVASQIGPVVASQIDEPTATATSAWLTEHVNPVGSAVIVDNTLSISGAAADALVTGNYVKGLESFNEDIINRVQLNGITLHQGGISTSDGMPVNTLNTRVYTSPLSYRDYIEVNSGYQILYVYKYDKNGFDTYSGYSSVSFTPLDVNAYYRLVLSKTDTTETIDPTDDIIKTAYIADTHNKILADIFNKNNESNNRISGVGYSLYQGTLNTTNGLPIYNSKRLYTMPIYYGDTLSLKSGYVIAYVYRFENNELKQFVPINLQSWSPISDITGSYYRAIISKSDNTQNILPTEDIVDSFVQGSSYNQQPTIKTINDDFQNFKGYKVNIKGFRVEDGGYNRADNSQSFLITVSEGEVISFEPSANNCYFLMVDSYNDSQSIPDYSTGYSSYGVFVTDYVKATVPSGAKYLIVLKNVGGNSDRTPNAIKINGFNIFKSSVENWNNDEKTYDNPIDLIADNSGYSANALKWLAIGDSYTEINDTVDATIRKYIKKGYMDRVCENLPMLECTNIGHSGWTFVTWESALSQITSGYDLYTIMLGTNDWSLSANWGTRSDFTNRTSGTSLGAFGKIIDKIQSVAPNAKIIVMTQFHRTVAIVPSGTVIESRNHDTYLPNSNGLYFADMEADIIACCESENIEHLDIFTLSDVTPKNAMKYAKVNTGSEYEYLRYPAYLPYIVYGETVENPYDANTLWVEYDGCHPSYIGMEIIANLLTEKIKKVMFK